MSGFFALLDDIATLAKLTLSTVDDTASMAVKTSAKVSAAAVDDVATTPQYVTGITPDRELPIIKKITLGSLRNKLLIILPIGLLLTAVAPWLLPVALVIGGAYLCFEGGEKILERFGGAAHAEVESGPVDEVHDDARPVLGQRDHLPHGDGEGGVEVAELRNVSDGPPWRSARCRPVDTHPAPADGHHAEQCPHECCLARAVGTHEGEGLPGRDPTSDTGEHGGGAVGEGGVLQGDDRFGSSGQGGRGGHRGSAITGVCHTVPHLTSEALGLHWARSAGISVTVPPQALVRLETLWRMEPM